MSDDQSVKDILEDIKKAISGSTDLDEEEDVLYLREEYLQNKDNLHDEREKKEKIEGRIKDKTVEEDIKVQNNQGTYNSKLNGYAEKLDQTNNCREQYNKEIYNSKLNGYTERLDQANNHKEQLILKENIEEIKMLLGNIHSKLQQPSKPSLTVEELVMSLLRPQLSEWLNTHLYELVKEVVEKELKNIIK